MSEIAEVVLRLEAAVERLEKLLLPQDTRRQPIDADLAAKVAAGQCLQCGDPVGDRGARGLCSPCFQRTRREIKGNPGTEGRLIALGLIAPPGAIPRGRQTGRPSLAELIASRSNAPPPPGPAELIDRAQAANPDADFRGAAAYAKTAGRRSAEDAQKVAEDLVKIAKKGSAEDKERARRKRGDGKRGAKKGG